MAPSTKVKTKLIDQIEQPAVLEDQAPTRTEGGRVVQPTGVAVDDELPGVCSFQKCVGRNV